MYNTINATAVLSDPLTPINDARLKIFFYILDIRNSYNMHDTHYDETKNMNEFILQLILNVKILFHTHPNHVSYIYFSKNDYFDQMIIYKITNFRNL